MGKRGERTGGRRDERRLLIKGGKCIRAGCLSWISLSKSRVSVAAACRRLFAAAPGGFLHLRYECDQTSVSFHELQIIRQQFPALTTRRLGTRGQSK